MKYKLLFLKYKFWVNIVTIYFDIINICFYHLNLTYFSLLSTEQDCSEIVMKCALEIQGIDSDNK